MARHDGTSESSQASWRPWIEELCRSNSDALDRLYGFGDKLIREKGAVRLPAGMEGGDIVHTVLLRVLSGEMPWPEASATDEHGLRGRSQARPPQIALPANCSSMLGARPLDDVKEGLGPVSRGMANTVKTTIRTEQRRRGKNYLIAHDGQRYSDPTDLTELQTSLAAALVELPCMQRETFVEVELNGRNPKEFAVEHHIKDSTVKAHLELAKRKLRVLLGEYDPDVAES